MSRKIALMLACLAIIIGGSLIYVQGQGSGLFQCSKGSFTLDTTGKITNQYIGNCPLGNKIDVVWRIDKDTYDPINMKFNYTLQLDFDNKCSQGLGIHEVRYSKLISPCTALKNDIRNRFRRELIKKNTKPSYARKRRWFSGRFKNA